MKEISIGVRVSGLMLRCFTTASLKGTHDTTRQLLDKARREGHRALMSGNVPRMENAIKEMQEALYGDQTQFE